LSDFKVAKWAKYKLLNLHGNHLIRTLAAFVFGEYTLTPEFGMGSAETACWEIERKQPNFQ
jgi:hypothetical protein